MTRHVGVLLSLLIPFVWCVTDSVPVSAASPPAYLVDHYFSGGSSLSQYESDAQLWACEEPNASGVVVLDFMAPAEYGGTYGTQQDNFPNSFMSDSEIATTAYYFAQGLTYSSYNGVTCNSHSGDSILLSVGASNSQGNLEPTNFTSWGSAWASMLPTITVPTGVTIEGALDMEQGTSYLGPTDTEAMAAGFNSADYSPYYILWDFGSDNGGAYPGNGWTANEVYDLAAGNETGLNTYYWDTPLPEIYSSNYDGLSDDWMSLSCYEINNGNPGIDFPGLTANGYPDTSFSYFSADTTNTGEASDSTCSGEVNANFGLSYLSTF